MRSKVRRTRHWMAVLLICGQPLPAVAVDDPIVFATDDHAAPSPVVPFHGFQESAPFVAPRDEPSGWATSGNVVPADWAGRREIPAELARFLQQNGGQDGEITPGGGEGTESTSGFDPALVREGQELFEISCTSCHDAERSTSKRKSYAGWLATVRRMAAKEDAEIPEDEHVPIATYLASLNPAATPPAAAGDGDGDAAAAASAAEVATLPFALNGTISPVYRGTDPEVENKGFFPDVWVGIEWQPPDSIMSGRVMTCTSCHGENNGLGVELVEGSISLDLTQWVTGCSRSELPPGTLEAELKAGRFPVPFGTFYQRSHPGALRTVSLPLMFNMGRRVGPIAPLQPVIPMPYADEGANVHLRKPLPRDWSATLDVYAVNGLQMGTPGIFFFSRSYRDNNSNLAVGGRGTIGNNVLRFGASVASGELQNDLAPLQNYKMSGADATFRWGDLLRASYEYAIRVDEPFVGAEAIVYGNLVEAELTVRDDPDACRIPKVSLLARYDTLEHRGAFGTLRTERFTWGVNSTLRGGSLLILNHEHWIFDEQDATNIFGLRWTAAF